MPERIVLPLSAATIRGLKPILGNRKGLTLQEFLALPAKAIRFITHDGPDAVTNRLAVDAALAARKSESEE